jgi:hypothetical protein
VTYPTRVCSGTCGRTLPFTRKYFEPRSGGGLRGTCRGCYVAQRRERKKALKPPPDAPRGEQFWNGIALGDFVQGTINAKYVDPEGHPVLEIGAGQDAEGIQDGQELASYVWCEPNSDVWNQVERRNKVRITQEADGIQCIEVLLDEEAWQKVSRGSHVRLWIKNGRTQVEFLKREVGV